MILVVDLVIIFNCLLKCDHVKSAPQLSLRIAGSSIMTIYNECHAYCRPMNILFIII